MLLFWAAIGGLILFVGGAEAVRRWLRPAQGGRVWCVLALLVGLLSLPGFLKHWQVLRSPAILCVWLAFALVNPWFEEGYWRGLLLDATERWGGIPSVTYSAAWFAASHPLVWGVHSEALRHPVILPVLAVVGIVWAMAYRRSGSLRWPIAGHMCANAFGLAVPVMLNLYLPYER
jgi:membrane protease YdiL (CAAX protease family)